MRLMHRPSAAGLLLVLFAAVQLPVATADETLATVIRAGLEHAPDAALPAAVQAQGEAMRARAGSLLADDPALLLRHESDAVADDAGYRYWEGGLEMPLWLPGQRGRQADVAVATTREAGALARLQHWQMAGEMRELLWSLALAGAEAGLAKEALESARKLQADVERRVDAGELARSETILATRETLDREAELAVAVAEHDMLLEKYRHLTGLQTLPADFAETAAPGTAIADDHPALVAAALAAARARSERDLVAGERRGNPVLTLGGISERAAHDQSRDSALALEVSVPLGLRSHAAQRTADAERRLTESTIELARVRRDLETQRLRVLAETAQGARTHAIAREQKTLAEEGLRLSRRAFELGENSLFTLLQAHEQALSARRALRISEIELARARARLNQVLGVIPE
jgi:outer membrane protein TolC